MVSKLLWKEYQFANQLFKFIAKAVKRKLFTIPSDGMRCEKRDAHESGVLPFWPKRLH